MALVLCRFCGQPLYLPPGYAGSLCSCGRAPTSTPHSASGAPSPASTQPGRASFGALLGDRDGGSGQPGPAVSTGSRGEKPRTGTPRGKGAPIEASPKPEGMDAAWKPSRDLLERAEAWFETKFFKKGGIGDDEWKPLLQACKTWGLPEDAKWRDWLKEQWDTDRANAVRVLVTAKAVEAPALSVVPPELKPLLDWLKAHPKSTVADAQAQVGPKVTEADFDKLTDLGLAFVPILGKWEAM